MEPVTNRLMLGPGDRLNNGARVIMAHQQGIGPIHGIALCEYLDQWVTWRIWLEESGSYAGSWLAESGMYFQHGDTRALTDYLERLSK